MEKEIVFIDISDEDFLIIAKKAHEEDITFNQIINKIIMEKMIEEENSKSPIEKQVDHLIDRIETILNKISKLK